jgi:cell wall-associated NlpC family hydrolase
MALLLGAPSALASGMGVTARRPIASPTVGQAAAKLSLRYLGAPYVWAGTTPAGFDCSGFTRFVYGRLGIGLPHSTYAQWKLGRHPRRRSLRPGDLVFFGLGHVGLFLGHGRFIHAPHTGEVVSIERLDRGGYAASFSGAVRLRAAQRFLAVARPVGARSQRPR